MSLQIWLPLTEDLSNQGLCAVSFNNSNTTMDSSGKLGKCCYFNGSSYLYENSYDWSNFNISEFSLCCWYKEPSPVASGNSQMICIGTNSGWNNIRIGLLRRTSNGYPMFSISDGTSAIQYSFTATSFTLDIWNHIACTYKNGLMSMYINGVLDKTYTTTIVPVLNSSQHLGIGSASNGAEKLTGYLNDVRIYDHALSQKEVKLLSQGLVAHYTLGDRYVAENLIINGFGELGSENWESSTKISTTEVPSADASIKESFYDGNMIKEFILLNRYHTYTISGYFKSTGATTGTTYPSIYAYDADKNFIDCYKCAEGFSATYKTTLAQPLNTGDTVIYATDLSNWTTASDNYYFHVAIFGYKDSFGTIYADMQYTQDSPAFGTKTDKSHINKTNNTITLNAPFTGKSRPAGTTICQATEGSTYYYPFGGIALSSLSDWVYKSAVLVPNNIHRLRYAKYLKYSTYWNAYNAGIKLVDNTDIDRTVYDSSGYNYHGTAIGTLSVSSDTPRYSASMKFANQNYIQYKAPANMYYATYSFWVNFDSFVAYGAIHIPKGSPAGGDTIWFSANTESTSLWAYFGGNSPHYNKVGTGNLVTNTWYHFVFTWNNGVSQWYLNGEPLGASVTYTGKTYIPNANYATIGNSYTGTSWSGTPFNGRISDFRLYATALSADDVKELYQTGTSIDNRGNMYSYELREL